MSAPTSGSGHAAGDVLGPYVDADTDFHHASIAWHGGRQRTALKYFDRAGVNGDIRCQWLAGSLYYSGVQDGDKKGVDKNIPRAAYFFKLGSEQKHDDSMNAWAWCLQVGGGVAIDRASAVHWYREAIGVKHELAYINLANCMQDGMGGLTCDYHQALEWYRASSTAGSDDAKWLVALYTDALDKYTAPTGARSITAVGVQWMLESAQTGSRTAQYQWGMALLLGRGPAANPSRALKWLNRSAMSGHREAQKELATLMMAGSKEWNNRIAKAASNTKSSKETKSSSIKDDSKRSSSISPPSFTQPAVLVPSLFPSSGHWYKEVRLGIDMMYMASENGCTSAMNRLRCRHPSCSCTSMNISRVRYSTSLTPNSIPPPPSYLPYRDDGCQWSEIINACQWNVIHDEKQFPVTTSEPSTKSNSLLLTGHWKSSASSSTPTNSSSSSSSFSLNDSTSVDHHLVVRCEVIDARIRGRESSRLLNQLQHDNELVGGPLALPPHDNIIRVLTSEVSTTSITNRFSGSHGASIVPSWDISVHDASYHMSCHHYYPMTLDSYLEYRAHLMKKTGLSRTPSSSSQNSDNNTPNNTDWHGPYYILAPPMPPPPPSSEATPSLPLSALPTEENNEDNTHTYPNNGDDGYPHGVDHQYDEGFTGISPLDDKQWDIHTWQGGVVPYEKSLLLTQGEVIHFSLQICRGLIHLQHHGIVHSQLSLSSIALCPPYSLSLTTPIPIPHVLVNYLPVEILNLISSYLLRYEVKEMKTDVILGSRPIITGMGHHIDCRTTTSRPYKINWSKSRATPASSSSSNGVPLAPEVTDNKSSVIDYENVNAYSLGIVMKDLITSRPHPESSSSPTAVFTRDELLHYGQYYSQQLLSLINGLLSSSPSYRISLNQAQFLLTMMASRRMECHHCGHTHLHSQSSSDKEEKDNINNGFISLSPTAWNNVIVNQCSCGASINSSSHLTPPSPCPSCHAHCCSSCLKKGGLFPSRSSSPSSLSSLCLLCQRLAYAAN